jgi:NAD(P)-dependent dehydrogenase (short-subunit alcohol dehydrogenase family)
MSALVPDPSLKRIYRLEATVGEPRDLGDLAHGRRRIVPLTGGTFAGPELNGTLLPGASADWQLVLPDGTALGDVRYTLQTDDGDLLYVQSRGVRHGSPEVLARLGRGEEVDASEYTFRTSTQIETAAPGLDWLNKGVFIGVGGPPARPRDLRDLPARMKVAVTTGASQGIGAGVAAAYRSAGYAVVGTSRSIEHSAERDYLTVQGDIADPETATRVIQHALDRFGRVDSLVNNAGLFIGKPFTDYTLADYEAVTAVNLAGFFHITQRAIRQMVTQRSGHIVNITTSLVDHANAREPSALASLTKGGLAAVTRSLATEYASRGVRVNAVAPGVVRTDTHRGSYEGMAELHPLGRMTEISDVVDGILYLEQAGFVTGETLHIDGGKAAGMSSGHSDDQQSLAQR